MFRATPATESCVGLLLVGAQFNECTPQHKTCRRISSRSLQMDSAESYKPLQMRSFGHGLCCERLQQFSCGTLARIGGFLLSCECCCVVQNPLSGCTVGAFPAERASVHRFYTGAVEGC